MKRCRIFVSGIVQGVCFRAFTQENAQLLGLKGLVRNTHDGRLEAVIEGDEYRIEELIRRIRQGPPSSRIDDISIDWEEPKNEFENFFIVR